MTAATDDGLAHGADNAGEAVGADVGMGVDEDVARGAVLVENVEDFVDGAALFAARVELAV